LIPYKDTDGSHSQLRRMLAVTDHFICSRDASTQPAQPIHEEELRAASSLFIHRRLRAVVADKPVDELLSPLLIGVLSGADAPMTCAEVIAHPAIAPLTSSDNLQAAIAATLLHLTKAGHLAQDGEAYKATVSGKKIATQAAQERQLEEDQAFGQFELDF